MGAPYIYDISRLRVKGLCLLAKYFCNCSDVLLVDILEYEQPVNTDKYCAALKILLKAIRRNAPVFLAMV